MLVLLFFSHPYDFETQDVRISRVNDCDDEWRRCFFFWCWMGEGFELFGVVPLKMFFFLVCIGLHNEERFAGFFEGLLSRRRSMGGRQ